MDEFDARVLSRLEWLRDNDKIGARTWKLASWHGCETAYMGRQMRRLEKLGKVERHERYSACNDIFWVVSEPPTA